MGQNHFATLPVALYGVSLLCCALAYSILVRVLVAHHAADSPLARAIGSDFKGNVSLVCYLAAILLAFFNTWIACALYVGVAVLWLIPDRRIEDKIIDESK